MFVSNRGGMHRFSWDMRRQPLGEGGGRGGGAAVPHRTYASVNAPWAAPGSYQVRLTAGGKSYTQPLTLRLDPRVKTSPVALTTLNTLTREMYDGAKAARAALDEAHALMTKLDAQQGDDAAKLKEKLAAIAPPQASGAGGRGGGRGGRGGPSTGPGTLESVSASMLAAAMAMQAADVAPTAREVAACAEARRQFADVMARWTAIKTAAGRR
jgi:hypothetical protein